MFSFELWRRADVRTFVNVECQPSGNPRYAYLLINIRNIFLPLILLSFSNNYIKNSYLNKIYITFHLAVISQVACHLMARLPNFVDRSNVSLSKLRLRSSDRSNLGWLGRKLTSSSTALPFFSAVHRPVQSLSFSFCQDRGYTHDGGARRRWVAVKMALTVSMMTATSASWKMMARSWRTTRAPTLISFSCRLVSDQLAMASGRSMQRGKVFRL